MADENPDTPVPPVVDTPADDNKPDATPPETPPATPEDVEVKTRGVGSPEVPEGEDDDAETVIDPDDAKAIDKAVSKQVNPLQEKTQQALNKLEVSEFIAENPQFAPKKEAILKHMAHPAYKDVPVDVLAYGLAGKDLMKMGAEAERNAKSAADSTVNPGTTVRNTNPPKNWLSASKEDFEAEKARVYGRR